MSDTVQARIAQSFARQGLMTTLGARLAWVGEGEVHIALQSVSGPVWPPIAASTGLNTPPGYTRSPTYHTQCAAMDGTLRTMGARPCTLI